MVIVVKPAEPHRLPGDPGPERCALADRHDILAWSIEPPQTAIGHDRSEVPDPTQTRHLEIRRQVA